jgi:hypothetical protein
MLSLIDAVLQQLSLEKKASKPTGQQPITPGGGVPKQ